MNLAQRSTQDLYNKISHLPLHGVTLYDLESCKITLGFPVRMVETFIVVRLSEIGNRLDRFDLSVGREGLEEEILLHANVSQVAALQIIRQILQDNK